MEIKFATVEDVRYGIDQLKERIEKAHAIPDEKYMYRETVTAHVHGRDKKSIPLDRGRYRLYLRNTNVVAMSHATVRWVLKSKNSDENLTGTVELRNVLSSRDAIVTFVINDKSQLELNFKCETLTSGIKVGICKVLYGIIQDA